MRISKLRIKSMERPVAVKLGQILTDVTQINVRSIDRSSDLGH